MSRRWGTQWYILQDAPRPGNLVIKVHKILIVNFSFKKGNKVDREEIKNRIVPASGEEEVHQAKAEILKVLWGWK